MTSKVKVARSRDASDVTGVNLNSDEQLVWYPLLLVKHRFYYVSVVQ